MNNKAVALIKKSYSSIVEWSPKPLKKPNVDADFDNLSAISRASESIKYNILCLEYFLSPRGGLREVIKICLSLCILFFLIWLPCIICLTLLLSLITNIESIFLAIFHIALYAFLSFAFILIVYAFVQRKIKGSINNSMQ